MDIPLKPRPWYKKYMYHILSCTIFSCMLAYAVIVSLSPKLMQVKEEEITIASAENGRFLEYVNAEGIVQPILTLKVNTMESGFVSEILKEEGAMLKKGDTILILANPELLRTIDDEQDEWQRQQRMLQEQEIEMQQRTITLQQQALDAAYEMQSLDKKLDIAREEFRMGIKSRAELDVAEAEYAYKKRKTELQLQSLKHDSTANRLRQELIRSDAERAGKRYSQTLQRTAGLAVTAPADGQLSYLAATPGQQVSSGYAIAELKALGSYKLHVALNEYYVDRITTGLPASIAYKQKDYMLRTSRVVPEVKDHTFTADLVFTGTMPDNMRIGKTYRVKIELGRPESATVIPRGDFYSTTGGQWIYRLSDDGTKATKTHICIGRQNPHQYEIVSGLEPGDRVIVSGYSKFGDVEELEIKGK